MRDELNKITSLFLDEIKKYFEEKGNPSFKLWFPDLKLVDLTDDTAFFTTPSNIRYKILTTKFLPLIKSFLSDIIGFEIDNVIITSTQSNADFEDSSPQIVNEQTAEEREEALEREKEIKNFLNNSKPENTNSSNNTSIITDYTFENFIEGESNKLAKVSCMAVAMEPGTIYNPLFIYGNSGLGKTHLLYAVINDIRKNHPNLKIVYKKSEDFTNELIDAIYKRETAAFKEKYRKVDVLLIDDIQFIANKEQTQEEFFHTFNALVENNKQIILTSDRPPKDIRPLEDRLRTRFEGGLLADVQKPSFELRIAIIKKKASQFNIIINDDLVSYMAERFQHDIRQIEGAIKKLYAISSLTGKEISKEDIDNVIIQIDPGNIPTDALIEKILIAVSKNFDVSVEDIKSSKRYDSVVNARQVAVYIIREITNLPLKKIGEIMGKNHATIMYSIEKCKENMLTKRKFGANVNSIIAEIKK